MIERNVGTIDRTLRVVVGVVLLVTIFLIDGPAQWIGLVGLVPLLTGLVGTCPIYRLIGVNTCATPASR